MSRFEALTKEIAAVMKETQQVRAASDEAQRRVNDAQARLRN